MVFKLLKSFLAKRYYTELYKKFSIGKDFCESRMYKNKFTQIYKNVKIKNGNKKSVYIGDFNNLSVSIDLKNNGSIRTGNYVFLNSGCKFYINNNLRIGNFCLCGPNLMIWDSDNHSLQVNERKEDAIGLSKRGLNSFSIGGGDVVIKDNVWIGLEILILGGVTIGENSVVSARSVVTKDIPANVLVGGVPAKIIKSIHNE